MRPYKLNRFTQFLENSHSRPVEQKQIDIPGGVFSIVPPMAGASDALDRVALAYNVVSTHYIMKFVYETYRNYHSVDFDFNRAFGICDQFEESDLTNNGTETVKLRLSEIILRILDGSSPFDGQGRYRVVPDIYGQHDLVKRLRQEKGLSETFFSKLAYQPSTNPFSDTPNTTRVVIHLRRQDISGELLFRNIPHELVPPELIVGVHNRPLLHLDVALKVLSNEVPQDSMVDLIVASDGMRLMARRFRAFPQIQRNIEIIEKELYGPLPTNSLNFSGIERVIGTGPDVTVNTMDAMFLADLVITSSSSFPRLPCRFGKTPIIAVVFDK